MNDTFNSSSTGIITATLSNITGNFTAGTQNLSSAAMDMLNTSSYSPLRLAVFAGSGMALLIAAACLVEKYWVRRQQFFGKEQLSSRIESYNVETAVAGDDTSYLMKP